jgi:excisionase family DNA binding protein
MTKVKDTLRSILDKVETGKVTSEDIQMAQSILDSSLIISPRSVLRKGTPHARVRRQFFAYPLAAQSDSQPEDFYTVHEVAKRFKVSDKAVYKWIDQNKIQYVRSSESSRDIRIPKAQFRKPPSKKMVDRREHELFKGAVEMELIRRKDLYRDEG